MVLSSKGNIRKTYGIDIQNLSETCAHVLVGVVTPSGVTWCGDDGRQRPPGEEWLVEILRSRGDEECLFLRVDGGSRAALLEHCQQCPSGVKPYWFPRNNCSCLLMLDDQPQGRP